MPSTVDTYLYADDTFVVSGNSKNEIYNSLNNALTCTGVWYRNHKLHLNVNKTKLMFFDTTPKLKVISNLPPLKYNDNTVEEVTTFKYLGVILDQRVTFDQHVTYMRRKVVTKMKTLG